MKRVPLFFLFSLITSITLLSQETILQEHFGSTTWTGHPSDYPDYTSNAEFNGDNEHAFQAVNSQGYPQASGGVAVYMGNWDSEANVEFVMECNTSKFLSVQLSFGFKHSSKGWGTCQLTNNFIKMQYSIDSLNWRSIDKALLKEGSSWPCADEENWAWIELQEELPSNANLIIRFTHTEPDKHPFHIDDITLTGYPPDEEPPTLPSNLQEAGIGYNEVVLLWNSSSDESGVKRYEIFKDGAFLMSTTDTVAEVKYQRSGFTADFTVVAVDVSENRSDPSNALSVTFNDTPADYRYSWQESQANILPGGDIEWKPKPFVFEKGTSVRYIDYEDGDDNNNGLSRATAWKHHPWDNNATGVAATESGIHTYVFKRGVVYRGVLEAEDSGTPIEPIRLTSDPTWGTGEAYFLGSVRIEGGWAKADATIAPNIPEPEKVWYVDVALPETKMVVEMGGEEFRQLHVARSPNYRWSDDDILTTWWKMTGKVEGNDGLWLTDDNNLVQDHPDYYAGATIFSQEDVIVMCSVWKQEVETWDPDNNRIKVKDSNFGGDGSYYFIENTPFLLDTVNEFYYDQSAQRLFIRLEGDKDPNSTIVEAATKTQLITIGDKHDIEISGITFGVTTEHTVRFGEEGSRSVIRISGLCNNINIINNSFYYVNGGISMNNTGSREQNSHSFVVSDNDFQNTGDHAIVFATSGAYIEDVNILRNNVFNSGYRHQGRWYSSIPAIYAQLFYGEIAGNVINYSFGNGIDLFWGKGGGSNAYVPFVRGLIHQNKASHTLIGTNDYGGIESWQGGPTYCYNNYSHDGGGYKHYNNSSIGYAYYFDGSFKHFVFNNIASGVSHNRNSAAIMQVLNYHNMFVHNTAYNTDKFFNAWKGTLALNGHNMYLANVADDINFFFKHEIAPEYIPFESYGYNVSSGSSFKATLESLDESLNLSQFRNKLEEYQSQLTITGVNATSDVLSDPAAKAFDLNTNTEAIGRGVKFFTAFPLAKVVGEWNFYKHPADTNLVMAENLYMTEDYSNRNTYEDVPMNHLNVYGISDTSFIHGDLEDWTTGALQFDGVSTFGIIEHASFSDVQSANLDMTTSNFILELYFKTLAGQTGGALIAKHDGSTGYSLAINDAGMAELTLSAGGSAVLAATATPVNDDQWHHLLVEVDRFSGITLYLDGDVSDGAITGEVPATDVSLSTTADFYVGRNTDGNYLHGAIDFLRVSKGSLYEARTTIDELYTWQTDGPFLYDMLGNPPVGQRDAGAIESASTCDMTVSDTKLQFETAASSQEIKVVSTDEIYLRDVTADFISVELKTDTVVVTVTENTIAEVRSGTFTVVSCNQTSKVKVVQAAAPCSFACDVDTLQVDHTAQSAEIEVATNASLTLNVPQEAFLSGQVNETGTRVTLQINANTVLEERSTEIEIVHCDGIHTVTIVQEAMPCQFSADADSINVSFESHTIEVALESNAELIVDYPMGSFISASLSEAQDKLTVAIDANSTVVARASEIIIYNCGDDYTIYVTQEGMPESVPTWDGGEVVIYPNPNSGGNFRVEVPTRAMGARYVISDISGKALHEGFLRQTDSEFSLDAAPGMYIFEIRKDNTVSRSKFMVTEKQ